MWENITETETFYSGLIAGINLYQRILFTAHERGEPLKINGEPYFIQSGDELLQEMLDGICR